VYDLGFEIMHHINTNYWSPKLSLNSQHLTHTLFFFTLRHRFIANPNGCYLLRSTHRRGSQIPQWIPLWKKIYFWVTLKSSQFPLFFLLFLRFGFFKFYVGLFKFLLFYCFELKKIVFFTVSEIWVFQFLYGFC